jgi:hypothetical protein
MIVEEGRTVVGSELIPMLFDLCYERPFNVAIWPSQLRHGGTGSGLAHPLRVMDISRQMMGTESLVGEIGGACGRITGAGRVLQQIVAPAAVWLTHEL